MTRYARSVILSAALFVTTSCTANVGDGNEAGQVVSTSAALSPDSPCLDLNVLRWQIPYPADSATSSMNVFSKDLPAQQANYWNRTDCGAMIVDWVPTFPNPYLPENDVEAFEQSTWDHTIWDPDANTSACQDTWLYHNVSTKFGSDSYPWNTALDEFIDCNTDKGHDGLDETLWFGPDLGPSYTWFDLLLRVRSITAAVILWYPIPVFSYLQADHGGDRGCPTGCCYSGQTTTCPNNPPPT